VSTGGGWQRDVVQLFIGIVTSSRWISGSATLRDAAGVGVGGGVMGEVGVGCFVGQATLRGEAGATGG